MRQKTLVGCLATLILTLPAAWAADFTWTNTIPNASGYWTNGVLWGQLAATPYPGSAGSDAAYLTNQFAGTYTNILDAALANPISTLAISNALGEAWLQVANAVLTNSTLALGSGGRVQIGSGGVVTGITSFSWSGTNGAIYLNNGGALFTANTITMGRGASSITGLVTSASGVGGVWNFNSQALAFSNNFNSLTLNNVTLTNVGAVTIGSVANNVGNTLTLSNGSRFFSGAITVGDKAGASNNNFNVGGLGLSSTVSNGNFILGNANGAGFNTMTITNATLVTTGSSIFVGAYSTSNRVSVLSNGTWNVGHQDLYVGIAFSSVGPASNNSLTVNGGVLTNINTLRVGNANNTHASTYNSLIVTNGGTVAGITAGLSIGSSGGAGASSTGNFVVVTGTGSVLNVSGGTILAENGVKGGSNNLTVANGGLAIVSGGFQVGGSTTSGSNWVLVTGSGSVLSNVGNFVVGNSGVGNQLVISNGARLSSTTVIVGANANNNNSVLANSGGVLEANTLTIGASTTGNTISNRNAIYQFTAAPTITSLTPGDIAITDGTISFRATGVANVTNTVANQISKIRFAGANTFMLNNASNTAVAVSQTYTFDTVGGNPSNYAHLAMINGPTAYANGNGADITIGGAGTFLASNTVATISGNFTNNGLADIVNATVNFQSALQVGGTLTLRNGFVTGTGSKTVGPTGLLRGDGSVVGNMTNNGAISPGIGSLGTLVFSNAFTLTGTYNAELDGTGAGSADQLIVMGELTLTGSTLSLSELVTANDAAYIIATYDSRVGTFNTVSGLPSGYAVDYAYGGYQIAIVVVPEPGTLALVAGGLVLLGLMRRRRRQQHL